MEILPIIGRLIDHGVATVVANFDGQGDSGEVYDLEFLDLNGDGMDYDECAALEDYVYHLVDSCVDNYGGDWVNNDGGYGEITIDIIDRSTTGNYNQRTVDNYAWESTLFE